MCAIGQTLRCAQLQHCAKRSAVRCEDLQPSDEAMWKETKKKEEKRGGGVCAQVQKVTVLKLITLGWPDVGGG